MSKPIDRPPDKPKGRPFDTVSQQSYKDVYETLQQMRLEYPTRRDDELLMVMAASYLDGLKTIREVVGRRTR